MEDLSATQARGLQIGISSYIEQQGGGVSGVELFNRSGRSLYASDELAGAGMRNDPELGRTLDGPPELSVRTVRGEETQEILVPIERDGSKTSAGIVRVTMPRAELVSTIESTERLFSVVIGLAALLVGGFWSLLWLSRRRANDLRRKAAHNEQQALHDDLTELPNRTLFTDRAQQAVAMAKREGGNVAIMVMDLDRFKEVNDTLGHHYGDLLLREVGRRLKASLRDVDTISRFGGDEFAVLLRDVPERSAAQDVATKIRNCVSRPLVLDTVTLSVDASVGISLYPNDANDFDKLLQHADSAMYAAKAKRTGTEFYAPQQGGHSRQRLALMHDFRSAIEDGELVLHYQPKLEMASERIVGVEALVRWCHPSLGSISPADFIPMVENTNLIGPMTSWILDAAIRQHAVWMRQGLELPIAVNLSARNLDQQLVAEVARLLHRYEMRPDHLELEITETVIMSDPHRTVEVLRSLRALGVRVAIDDFGTGHSSLSYLQRLPVTTLKVAQSFVERMQTNHADFVIVRSTIDLAHSLGLEVVAEGVENQEMWVMLSELGCNLAQGHWRARAVSAADVPNMVNLVQVRV